MNRIVIIMIGRQKFRKMIRLCAVGSIRLFTLQLVFLFCFGQFLSNIENIKANAKSSFGFYEWLRKHNKPFIPQNVLLASS